METRLDRAQRSMSSRCTSGLMNESPSRPRTWLTLMYPSSCMYVLLSLS